MFNFKNVATLLFNSILVWVLRSLDTLWKWILVFILIIFFPSTFAQSTHLNSPLGYRLLLSSISSPLLLSMGNPSVPASSSGNGPLVKEPLIPTHSLRHIEKLCWAGILNYTSREVILLYNLLFTPIHKAGIAHEHKSTKGTFCQIIHSPQYHSCHVAFLMKQCVLLGIFMAGTGPGRLSGRDMWMT